MEEEKPVAQSANETTYGSESSAGELNAVDSEQRLFILNGEQWDAFNAFLDRPPQEKPALRRLLTEPGVLG